MKKTILAVVALLLSINLQAQKTWEEIQELKNDSLRKIVLNTAPYIVEGEVIKKETYCDKKTKRYYKIVTIDITHIFRGDTKLDYGIVEIVVPDYYGFDFYRCHSFNKHINQRFNKNTYGIFFCKTDTTNIPSSNTLKVTNRLRLETSHKWIYHCYFSYHPKHKEEIDDAYDYRLLKKPFYTRGQVYDYMKTFDGIATPKRSHLKRKKKDNSVGDTTETYKRNADFKKWYNAIIEKAPIKKPLKKRGAKSITFTMENPQLTTQNSISYLEFDIMVSSNESTWFDNSLILLEYEASYFDDAPFYPNMSSSVEVTRGIEFDNESYIEPMPADRTDIADNILAIGFGINYGAHNISRTEINMIPKNIFHVKMEIKDIAQPAKKRGNNETQILFYDYTSATSVHYEPFNAYSRLQVGNFLGETIEHTSYEDTWLDHNLFYYSPANFINPEPFVVYKWPVIHQFELLSNPNIPITEIDAGKGEILVIKGENFGDGRGSGKIMFKDANSKGLDEYIIDNIDYQVGEQNYEEYWTDTEIRIVLSSRGGDNGIFTPGSGNIEITTDVGRTCRKYLNINANYIEFEIEAGGKKYPMVIDNKSLQFKLDESITLHPNSFEIKKLINRAFAEWSCKLDIKLELVDNFTNSYRENIISIGSETRRHPAITYPIAQKFCQNPDKVLIYQTGIMFSESTDWYYGEPNTSVPVSQKSFYANILHEIGHVLGLHHVIDDQKLMSYTGGEKFNIDNATLNDVSYIIEKSKATEWSCFSLAATLTNSPCELNCPDAPPTSPTLATIEAMPKKEFYLEWESNSCYTKHYEIEWSNNNTNFNFYNVTTNNFITVSMPEAGVRCYFRIKAISEWNEQSYSNVLSDISLASNTPPSAPTWQTLPYYNGSGVYFGWMGSPSNVDTYEVYRSLNNSSNFTLITTLGSSANNYTDNSVMAGNAYYYKITAVNSNGSTASSVYTVSTPPPVGANISNPVNLGTISYNNTYTDTKYNYVENNYGNTYSGADNKASDDIFY